MGLTLIFWVLYILFAQRTKRKEGLLVINFLASSETLGKIIGLGGRKIKRVKAVRPKVKLTNRVNEL